MFGFKKKPTAAHAGAAGEAKPASGGNGENNQRDARKARAWFERAATVADTRNWDYAIECYLNGLKHEPDNMIQHEALYEVAKRRKVSGGKPAGFAEKLRSTGKDPVSKLLDAEKLWAKDPLNVACMLAVMKKAVEAHRQIEDLDLGELVFWVGSMLLEANAAQKRPSKQVYLEARELFSAVEAFGKAVEACKLALALDESDESLLLDLRNLEAERTIRDAQYGGDFRTSIRDADKQRVLEMADETGKSASAVETLIQRYRADFEENPEDLDRLNKLVKALETRETDDSEQEAIRLLQEAYERTGQYRLQVRASDIQIKQYNRHLRLLKQAVEANPNDAAARKAYNDLYVQARMYELKEFTQRVKNYPTDLRLRFELGKLLLTFQKYDEAIGAFQEAQNDPKNRAAAQNYLGRCYAAKGWHEEAIESFRKAIDAHPLTDDRQALEMRYYLMESLEASAKRDKSVERAKEAREIASQILQTNINFKDIRQRVDQLRQLSDQLQSA